MQQSMTSVQPASDAREMPALCAHLHSLMTAGSPLALTEDELSAFCTTSDGVSECEDCEVCHQGRRRVLVKHRADARRRANDRVDPVAALDDGAVAKPSYRFNPYGGEPIVDDSDTRRKATSARKTKFQQPVEEGYNSGAPALQETTTDEETLWATPSQQCLCSACAPVATPCACPVCLPPPQASPPCPCAACLPPPPPCPCTACSGFNPQCACNECSTYFTGYTAQRTLSAPILPLPPPPLVVSAPAPVSTALSQSLLKSPNVSSDDERTPPKPSVMCCYYKQGKCKMSHTLCWYSHEGSPDTPCHYGAVCKVGHRHLVGVPEAEKKPTYPTPALKPSSMTCLKCKQVGGVHLQKFPVYIGSTMTKRTRAHCLLCLQTYPL